MFVGVIAALCIATAPASAQDDITAENLTDAHIQLAIGAIVDELYDRKHPQRFWEPPEYPERFEQRQAGGWTAMVALALLQAGESYQGDRLRDVIAHLEQIELHATYSVSVRALVWALLPPKYESHLERDTKWLLQAFDPNERGWFYESKRIPGQQNQVDNSNAQFGALALWEANKRGARIPQRVWHLLENRFISNQHASGGWDYNGRPPATGSMTTAGLATLFITQDYLHREDAIALGGKQDSRHSNALHLGLKWMDENFSAEENPGHMQYFFYYLWGVERVGLASGYRFFGEHDWYRAGAAETINQLCEWDPVERTMHVHKTIRGRKNGRDILNEQLGFALMFLSRGRVPVAINKLQIDDWAWNSRPRDAANLTEHIRQTSETNLNWQIVDAGTQPDLWLDAPLLYIAGSQALPVAKEFPRDLKEHVARQREEMRGRAIGVIPADEQPKPLPSFARRMKRYLDLGGMVLAVNEGRSSQFSESVEELGLLMYPQYEWRDLPDEHWAYTLYEKVEARRLRLRGLSNGVRELMIVCRSPDLPRTFQAIDERNADHFTLATNIYFYASEMNRPKPRLASPLTHPALPEPTATVRICRAMYDGNWNAEPLALDAAGREFAQARLLDLDVTAAPLSKIHTLDPAPHVVLVQGTSLAHTLSPSEVEAVEQYVRSGGMIVFEAVGGTSGYARTVEMQLTEHLGQPSRSMLRTPIITGDHLTHGVDVGRTEYRPFSFEFLGSRDTTPRLRAITIDDEPRLIFSDEDISFGLLDQPRWGVSGYTPSTARSLIGNLLEYAASDRGAAKTSDSDESN